MTQQLTQLEERLGAALAARANQIDENDLAPAELPAPTHRGRGLLVLAAAACTALVIGVPYGIAQLDGSDAPEGPLSTATPSPTPSGTEGADWPVAGTGRIDLDGDGTEETMRLRIDPRIGLNPMGYVLARVEVDLPSGTVYTVIAQGSSYHLEGKADLPGSDGEELLVTVGTTLEVFDLVDGLLRQLDTPHDPPLIQRTDSLGRLVTWVADDKGLATLRSVDPVPSTADRYTAERWTWKISDGALVPGTPQQGCAEGPKPDALVSCFPGVPEILRPEKLTSVGIATTIRPDFTIGGHAVTARLVPREGFSGDYMADGDVRLVVSAGENTWETDLGPGPLPLLYEQPVRTSESGRVGLLVGYQGDQSEGFVVFTWVNDRLVALANPDPSPALATSDDTLEDQQYRTWIQDSWLYTAVATGTADRFEVFRWKRKGEALEPVTLGIHCFGRDDVERAC